MKPHDPALRLIILYKRVRAAGSGFLSLAVTALALGGVTERAKLFVAGVHDHATSALWLEASALAGKLLSGDNVWVIVGALVLDAAVLLLEAWSLSKGWSWGPWLVVVSSSALVPFEVTALFRHPSPVRVAALAINLVIVGYLLVRIRRER
jgi:uncharacterized membrane protein (DUF2068 family)